MHPHRIALEDDLLEPGRRRSDAETGHREQPLDRGWKRAVAVEELLGDRAEFGLGRGIGETAVGLEPQSLLGDVVVGDVGVDGEFDPSLEPFPIALTAMRGERLPHHADIQIEADLGDVAALLTAEQVACPADLEILHGDLHPRTEIVVLRDGRQPLVGRLAQRLLGWVAEIGVAALTAAPDAAAQLMQLGQPESVRAVHDEGVGVRDVDAVFHDRRADEDVNLALPECHHDSLEFVLVHLSVGNRDTRLRHEIAHPGCRPIDGVDPVVHEEDLSIADEFPADRRRDLSVLIRPDIGQDRQSLLGRSLDGRHFANARQGHLERARNGGRRHGEDVDRGAQRLDVLLVLDAEALLLVDDEESEVLEPHIRGEQSMGSDDDVDAAVGEASEDLLRLGIGVEAREPSDRHRERGVATREGSEVLLDEQGRGHEHRDLGSVLNRLERRPDGDLGLAIADVTTDHAIHGDLALHVGLDLVYAGELVGRLDIGEGVFEFVLPRSVGGEGATLRRRASGIEPDQFPRDLPHGASRPGFRSLPVASAESMEAGRFPSDIAGDLIELVGRNVQPIRGLSALR